MKHSPFPMRFVRKALAPVFAGVVALVQPLPAQTVSVATDPVGVVNLTALGLSDTAFSLPLQRPSVFSGIIASTTENTITFSGTPNWTTNQFVYASPGQTNTYFLLIKSGARNGMIYTVASNGAGNLTVDPAGDTLASVLTDGTVADIVPYWTLNTLFPEGANFKASTSFTPVSSVLIPNPNQLGQVSPITDKYFYYSGVAAGGEGWRKVGLSPTEKFDDLPISPDTYIVIRHSQAGETTLPLAGSVRMADFKTPVGTIQPNTAQDNAIGIPLPISLTLTQSQLFESGIVSGSPTFTPVDTVAFYDNSTVGVNKPLSNKYFYYTGTAVGGAGWRKVGAPPTNKYDTAEVFGVGAAVVVRKSPVSSPSSALWTVNRTY